MTTDVLDHILSSISAASGAQALGARQRLAGRTSDRLGSLEDLAIRLAAARHNPRPAVARRAIVVCAADHGVSDPGVDLGDNNPTVIGLRHVAAGEAAVNAVSRTADATLVLVDCGVRGGSRFDLGAGVMPFRIGDGTADIAVGPAMTADDAVTCLQTGIGLVFSLADNGLDIVCIGQLSTGSQPASAAVTAVLTGASPGDIGDQDANVVRAAIAANQPDRASALDVLTKVGGTDIGIMAGIILGAASINVPVVLDDHATSAAALIAAGLAPPTAGYLIASHGGSSPCHRLALESLELAPLFELGLAHGEGTGAALALPMIDAASRLLADPTD